MTVPVPGSLTYTYLEDGVTTVFSYPVRFLEATELMVVREAADGSRVPLVYNTDYTVSGAGSPTGGLITRAAATNGGKITISRSTVAKQLVDLKDAQRNPAEAVELQLDRLAMASQDARRDIDRSVMVDYGAQPLKPLPSPEPGKVLAGNADGSGYVNAPMSEAEIAADVEAARQSREGSEQAATVAQAWAQSPTPPDGAGTESAKTAADRAKTQADTAGDKADIATTAASASEAAASRSELARDAATVNADVYADTASGIAATTNGQQFQVAAADTIIRYRNDSGTATEVARFASALVMAAISTDVVGWSDVSASGSVIANSNIYYWPGSLRGKDGYLSKIEIALNVGGILIISVDTLNGDGTLTHVADYSIPVALGASVIDNLDIPVPAGCIVGVGGMQGLYYDATAGDPSYWFVAAIPTTSTAKSTNSTFKLHYRLTFSGDIRNKADIAYASAKDTAAAVGGTEIAGWSSLISTGSATPGNYAVILRDTPATHDGQIVDVTIGASVTGAVKVAAVTVAAGIVTEIGASKTLSVAPGVQTVDVGIPISEGQYVAFTAQQSGAFQFQANANPTGVRYWEKNNGGLAVGDAVVGKAQHRFEISATIKTGILGLIAETGGPGAPAVPVTGDGGDETSAFSRAGAPASTAFVPSGNYDVTGLGATGHGLWGPGKVHLNDVRYPLPMRPESYTLLEQVRENLIEHAASGDVIALIGDSISHFSATTGSKHWFNMFTAWLNYGIAADEPIMTALRPLTTVYVPSFYGVTTSGSISTGTNGPIKESAILADGASLSFTGAYEQVDVWYTRQSSAGDLIFSYNGTDYKTVTCTGTTQLDTFSAAGATGQAASGTYEIRASGGAVEVTGLLRLAPLSGLRKRFRTGRFAHGSYTFASFDAAAVTSILAQCSYGGGKCVPILALGTNDMFVRSPAATIGIAENIIDTLKAANVPRIFALPPMRPHSAWDSNYAAGLSFDPAQGALRRLYREKNVIILPIDGIDMIGLGYQKDGLHPNDDGNDTMLVAIAERLAALS